MKSHALQLQLLHSWATLSLTHKDTGRSSGLALALGNQLTAVLLSNLYLGLQFWFDSANQSIPITRNFSLLTTPLFLLSHSLLTYFSHLKSLVFICVRVIMRVSVHAFGGQRQPRVLVLNLHLALRLFDCSLLCTPAHLAHKLPRMFLPLPLHIWPQVHKGHRHALLTDFHVGLAVYHVVQKALYPLSDLPVLSFFLTHDFLFTPWISLTLASTSWTWQLHLWATVTHPLA